MKQNYLLKTLVLLMTLVGGVSASWADNVNIPGDIAIGSYINWSNATTSDDNMKEKTGDADGGNLGNTGKDKTASFTVVNNTVKDYLLSLKSGLPSGTATWNVKMTNNTTSQVVLDQDFTVSSTGAYSTYNNSHEFIIRSLPTGTYTLVFTGKTANSSSSCGNLKYLAFADSSHSPSNLINNGTEIGSIYNGNSHVYYFYNSTPDTYGLQLEMYRNSGNTVGATINITIEDISTHTNDFTGAYEMASDWSTGYCGYGSGRIVMAVPTLSSVGFKKLTLSFASTHESYLCNYRNVGFKALTDYDASKGDVTLENGLYYGNCRWNENSNGKVSYITSQTKIYYYVYSAAQGTFDLTMNAVSSSSSGTWTATVYDFNTGSTNNKSYSHSTTGEEKIEGLTLKPGLNRVALTFAPTGSFLLDYNRLTFIPKSLTLDESKSYNFASLNNANVNVTLTRSIAANKWSTIVLPFDLASSSIETVFGAGASVAEFTSDGSDESTLNFTTTLTDSKMKANQPYAIKVASAFSTATINNVNIVEGTPTQTVGETGWRFIGNYTKDSSIAASTGSASNFFFSNNTLYKATGSITLQPFRAYFQYAGETGARQLSFVIDDEGETTEIGIIRQDGTMESLARGVVYNLNGQQVKSPVKGLYIVNGRKVVIK